VSLLAIAWTVVGFLVGVLVLVLCVLVAKLFGVITRTSTMIDRFTNQTMPLLAEVGTTVSLVNQEIGRVDGILATAETATAAVGNVVNVVSTTVTSPLVRLSAFAWGLRKAVSKAAEDDGGTAGSRRRGRRRR
jgi:predicted PurR-regulated permease PerM